ncbi:hypothetical protein CEUSTIGMA_g5398.t1 [Chlamydomonas eustigma]|uniref:ABC transporter domain-containing protein n=1 Tax=Chlamydomonas eustigma TaxID=1157962 RepID=A0A250X4H3_9CHLO|nr:hypothetical protein CEUSTIGMA_g5398.t1 [Chlamydomonas eustigma]|eukprot:GAX77956.1 hypothetical protein CEUSTIGMA_g5398.t1 [Chlamydomonas eustigma]
MDCKFEVQGLKRILGESLLFSDINFTLSGSERLFVTGPSGVGKTLFLRLLACLDEAQGGELRLNGKTPSDYGFPAWRALVTYVPQSRVNFKGTPAEFYFQAQQFASQKGRPRGDLPTLINDLGLEHVVLNQAWTELSGGQAQRVAIAIAVALRPAVLLLDEPTSACDQVSVRRVEKVLQDSGCTLIWISHDPEQPSRLGGKVLELPGGTLTDIAPALLAEAGGGSATSSSERLEARLPVSAAVPAGL